MDVRRDFAYKIYPRIYHKADWLSMNHSVLEYTDCSPYGGQPIAVVGRFLALRQEITYR